MGLCTAYSKQTNKQKGEEKKSYRHMLPNSMVNTMNQDNRFVRIIIETTFGNIYINPLSSKCFMCAQKVFVVCNAILHNTHNNSIIVLLFNALF